MRISRKKFCRINESDATKFVSKGSNDLPDFAGGALVGLFESIAQRVGELETLEPEATAPLYFCGNL